MRRTRATPAPRGWITKNFALGSLAAILVMALCALGYGGLGFADVSADSDPSPCETKLMTSAVHASVRQRAGGSANPLPDSPETLIAGGKLYMDDCVGCHGAPGKPPSSFGATFYPRAPQFPQIGSRYSQPQIFWVAKHGVRLSGMYPQAHYSDADLWRLAAFIGRIRSLPPSVARAIQDSP